MTTARAAPSYLEAAGEAGLLGEFRGHTYVGGPYCDPVSGEAQWLVEYCDPVGLADHAWCAELPAHLAGRGESADALILRVRGGLTLPSPWMIAVSYLRYQGQVGGEGGGAAGHMALTVSVSGPEHVAFISDRLLTALRDGYCSQGQPISENAAMDAVREIMSAPGRLSYLAFADGKPIGHLTVLTDAHDDVIAEDYIDLVDMLVDSVDDAKLASAARAALTDAAIADAARLGKPLIGNVTHPGPGRGSDQAAGVLRSLRAKGWRLDYADWRWQWPESLKHLEQP